MLKNSNLYIERIYAEHPLASWAFDDDISYRQLLAGRQDTFISWSTTDGLTPLEYLVHLDPPTGAGIDGQRAFEVDSSFGIAELALLSPVSASEFDRNCSTAFFSVNVYHSDPALTYEIAVSIDMSEYVKSYDFGTDYGWKTLFVPFDIPDEPDNVTAILRFDLSSGTTTTQIDMPTIGQRAEERARTSRGYAQTAIPAAIAAQLNSPSSLYAVTADSYGIDDTDNGCFIMSASPIEAYARSAGIPMVFGSKQSVFVSPAPNGNPSIVIPGKGLLNNTGKYGNFTLETWVRLHNGSPDPVRIIGPTASNDGIYLEEGFISIVVGPYTKSYFLGKFNRPMLLHFEYSPERVSLLVNGEQAISIDIDVDKLTFPTARSGSGWSRDWIGIYGNAAVDPFEIDSVSIYPYLIPPEIAKRHFVYGQGVQEYDFSNNAFDRQVVQFDYPYAEYAYNIVYPDRARWRSGLAVNLDTTSSVLRANKYTLPTITSKDSYSYDFSLEDFFLANRDINSDDPDFFPYLNTHLGNDILSTILFSSINVISDRVRSIFMMGRRAEVADYDVPMRFKNTATGESITMTFGSEGLTYAFWDSFDAETTLYVEPVATDDYFVCGIDIPSFSASFQPIIGNFFSDYSRIALNVGGWDGYGFNGRIFGVHFSNKFFHDRDLASHFENGIIQQESGVGTLGQHIGSYSLLPIFKNDTMGLDIGSVGYWEDLIPLSVLGKTVSASVGTSYDLDFVQFNVDVPYEEGYGDDFEAAYRYYQLYLIENLDGMTYADFNDLYPTYGDLAASGVGVVNDLRYSTGFKSFVTLQPNATVGNNLYSSYVAASGGSIDGVIDINTASAVKYPVFDNSIIMIPDDIDFNDYYLGVHLEILVRGTIEKNMTIKRLELASWAANDGLPTMLGTKRSYPVYPEAI